MNDHPRQLPIPDPASDDPRAVELLRVWAAGGKQHVALSSIWDDPAAWGIMLVDLSKHVALMFAENGWEFDGAIGRLRQGFDAEWEAATDVPSGGINET